MKIQTITTKMASTKFGNKEKYVLTDENGKVLDCWKGNWNMYWKVGDEIDIKPEQIKEREWEGKKYYSIQAPLESRGGMNVQPLIDLLKHIADNQKIIEEKIDSMSTFLFDGKKEEKQEEDLTNLPF